MMQLVLNQCSDPNVQPEHDRDPLHRTYKEVYLEVVQILVDTCAKMDRTNSFKL